MRSVNEIVGPVHDAPECERFGSCKSTGLPDESVMYMQTHPAEIFGRMFEAVQVGRETAPHRGVAMVSALIDEIRSAGRTGVH